MLDLDYQRAVRGVINTSPEQRAVRTLDPIMPTLARADAQQKLQGVQTGMTLQRIGAQREFAREDMRDNRRDSMLALGVGGANLGLNAVATVEQRKAQEEERQRMEDESTMYSALGEVMQSNFDALIKRLRVDAGGK